MAGRVERRERAVRVFVERRGRLDVVLALVAAVAVVTIDRSTSSHRLAASLPQGVRSSLYASIAGTGGALLGFVLAALAILITLPPGERLRRLQGNVHWELVPRAFVRAAWSLLALLVAATVGIPLDARTTPRFEVEAVISFLLVFALFRVIASIVALQSLLAVVAADQAGSPQIRDP